jgi:hypothetical protein
VTPAAMSLLLAAAAPSGPTFLDCRLVTPGGETLAFAVSMQEPGPSAAVLTPVAGSVWPAARLAGGGGFAAKKSGVEGIFYFGGSPAGAALKIVQERATLYLTHGNRDSLPRAYGFCLPASPHEIDAKAPVTVNAGVDGVRAFDSASWPAEGCALLMRSGRRGRVNYAIADGGAGAVMASDEGLLPARSVTISRDEGRSSNNPRIRIGDGRGPSGFEIFLVDKKAAEAVKLLELTRLGGSVTGNEPAAGICGYDKISRRAVMR